MATTARFGRLPRTAPSLTSTIVALAQQYQAQRDRNIEDAWKNGGSFEGKKVNDSAFLAYWKERLASVSQEDPMWDYYNNLIHGYEFNIAESKMGLRYARGSASDSEMAAFYSRWANKMPRNSANWRTLMTQAAKFKSAAAARASGSATRAAAQAYARKQQNTYNTHEAPYEVATGMITQYAVAFGILDAEDLNDPDGGWSKLTTSAGENDPINFTSLLQDIMDGTIPGARENITRAIRQYDPDFDGTLTDNSLARLANNARNGATIRSNRARKAGDTSGQNAANDAKGKYGKSSMVIRALLGDDKTVGFIEQNEYEREQMDAVLAENSGASPVERAAAVETYKNWLQGDGMDALVSSFPQGTFTPGSKNYNVNAAGILGRLTNTVNALNGKATGQTLKDDPLAFSTSEAGAESDAVKLAGSTYGLRYGLDAVANGSGVMVRVNDKGQIDPNGKSIEIRSRTDPDLGKYDLVAMPDTLGAGAAYTASDGTVIGGAKGTTVLTAATPIKMKVYASQDPATGEPTNEVGLAPGITDDVATQITIIGAGGLPVTLYGVWQGGQRIWTTESPARAGTVQTKDKDGNIVWKVVDPSAYDPATGGVVRTPGGRTTKQVVTDPRNYLNPDATKTSRNDPEWDPKTDRATGFDSPLEAYANKNAETMKHVSSMGDDAVRNTQRAYFADQRNWTPEMAKQYEATGDYEGVVNDASSKLVNTLQFNRYYGYTPEEQDRTRAALKSKAESEAAARQGVSVPQYQAAQKQAQEDAEKQALVAGLQRWDAEQRTLDPRSTEYQQRKLYGAPTEFKSKLPEGWSPADLIYQPGMSLQQANDLVARITGGKLGKEAPGERVVNPDFFKPLSPAAPYTTQPYQNPYMPKPGQKPVSPQPTKVLPQTGQPVAPKPPVQPKPVETPQVNPNTGFVTGSGPAAGPNAATGFSGVKMVGGQRYVYKNGQLQYVQMQGGRAMS